MLRRKGILNDAQPTEKRGRFEIQMKFRPWFPMAMIGTLIRFPAEGFLVTTCMLALTMLQIQRDVFNGLRCRQRYNE